MNELFKELIYIYASTKSYEADRNFYVNILKVRMVWEFNDFEAKVAAFDFTGSLPYFLIADHRHTTMPRLLYRVDNLKSAIKQFKLNGLAFEGSTFELPDGPCIGFADGTGNSFGIFQAIRPQALEKKYKSSI